MEDNERSDPKTEIIAAEAVSKKDNGIVRKSRDFIGNALSSIKGRDLHQLVEEFTAEVTLVAEGLSEDQEGIRREMDKFASQQTLMEADADRREQDSDIRLQEINARIDSLQKRLDAMDKREAKKKESKQGLSSVLRQATWLVGIICFAWLVVTVMKLLGGS